MDTMRNELLVGAYEIVAGKDTDLDAAEAAFFATPGDFRAKWTAAVTATLAPQASPEVWIDVPENPKSLSKAELDALVRPSPFVFVKSHPTIADLLRALSTITWRQARRPDWIPRTRPDGTPLSPATPDDQAQHVVDGVVEVDCLSELGPITVRHYAGDPEPPRLPQVEGGIGQWEAALFQSLGFTRGGPECTIELDAEANEALITDESLWWRVEPPQPKAAAEDPGVASELLATSETLGEIPVLEDSAEAYCVVQDALAEARDWRYSPCLTLDTYDPGENTWTRAASHAAIAGWSDSEHSGFVVYVFGGALNEIRGLSGAPVPLHSYVLVATRAADGSDRVETVHRITVSCPGEYWCHRKGCPQTELSEYLELGGLLRSVATATQAARRVSDDADAWAAFQQLYGGGDGDPEIIESVLDLTTLVLAGAGWTELNGSVWDGGLEERFYRRGIHLLQVDYDPTTRQIRLCDGRAGVALGLDILADEEAVFWEGGTLTIDVEKAVEAGWRQAELDALLAHERGQTEAVPLLTDSPQISIVGLHPYSDGTLRAPESTELATHQLTAFLIAMGIM